MTSRELALAVVRDVFPREGRLRGAHEAFDYRAKRSNLDERDRAFAAELAYGAIKGRRFLDWVLAPFLGVRATTIPPAIGEILRLGAYQLRSMGVEPRAAVSESVGLAKKYGHRGTAGLVNAVLRRVAEQHERIPLRADFEDGDDYLATLYSFPTWIVATLREAFGDERLEEILLGLNGRAAMALRVNLLRTNPEDAIAEIRGHGVDAEPSALAREMVLLADRAPAAIRNDAGLRWEQQGEIAGVPVDVLDPQPGERVIDLCSGRGNKTLQIAGRMSGTGTIEAVESDLRKAAQGRERMEAFGIANVRIVEADVADETTGDPGDRVLLDAPCSGLGILGRQPEARWRKEPGDSAQFAEIQQRLLDAAARRIAPGGRLVYSVCTVDPREGVDRIAALLESDPDLRRAAPAARYAPWQTLGGDLLFPPGLQGRDGFYVAVLERPAA